MVTKRMPESPMPRTRIGWPLVAVSPLGLTAASFPLFWGVTGAPWRLCQVAGRSSGHDPHASHDAELDITSSKLNVATTIPTLVRRSTSKMNSAQLQPAKRMSFIGSWLTGRKVISGALSAAIPIDMTLIEDLKCVAASPSTQPRRTDDRLFDGVRPKFSVVNHCYPNGHDRRDIF